MGGRRGQRGQTDSQVCEWERVRLGQGREGRSREREGQGRAPGSRLIMFRHFLGPPCSRLLSRLPAGHFQKVWFLLQHLGGTSTKL